MSVPTEHEVADWMRLHPEATLRLVQSTNVLQPMALAMWCDHGHIKDADNLYEYGPETCHLHPLLYASGRGPICPGCKHEAVFHAYTGCYLNACACERRSAELAEEPGLIAYGDWDYRQWVQP